MPKSYDEVAAELDATYHALAASQKEVERLRAALEDQHKATDDLWNERTALRAQLAAAQADSKRAERERDEMRGVIETFGRVELLTLEDRDELELRYRVSGLVLRAGGIDVFGCAIRECAARWREKLDALRRAGMSTTEKMFEALADTNRSALDHAMKEGDNA